MINNMDLVTLFQVVKEKVGEVKGTRCGESCFFCDMGDCNLFGRPEDDRPKYRRYDTCLNLFGTTVKQYFRTPISLTFKNKGKL